MSWAWEYLPNEHHVTDGVSPVVIAEVETKADELVRAAAALYLDGTTHTGPDEKMKQQLIPNGFFHYTVIRRQERIYILRITYIGG
ncbi:hypothetical protein [Streptacidiphilus sp. PAMC 29251]